MRLKHLVAAGAVTACMIGSAFHIETAEAAYSGTIVRSVCGAAGVPRLVDRSFYDHASACFLKVTDAANPGTYHYAAVTIPMERATSTVSVTTTVHYTGNLGVNPCAQTATWDTSTTAYDFSSAVCNNLGNPLTPASVVVPVNGAISVSLAGVHSVQFVKVSHGWTANGT